MKTPKSKTPKSKTGGSNQINIVVAVLATIIVVSGGFYTWQQTAINKIDTNWQEKIGNFEKKIDELTVANSQKDEQLTELNDKDAITSEVVNLDDTWNRFIGYKLGFMIDIPKETNNGSIELDEQEDRLVIKAGMEPVTSWEIIVGTVANEEELTEFAKNIYGSAYYIDQSAIKENEDIIDITLGVEAGEDCSVAIDPGCLAGEKIFLYDQSRSRVATWNISQEPTFVLGEPADNKNKNNKDDEEIILFDERMISSFEFIR